MPTQLQVPGIVRFLYAHNPFYVISAACIIYTLKLLFRPGEVDYIDPWALMGAIAGYTLLMAVTGYLVVKWGRVWEDARTIFLVLLLLFLATSVTFDELLNLNPAQGRPLIATGFALAVLVSEGLFWGLGIRVRALFRIPYHLWLALLYFFPLWVSPEITELPVIETSWRLLAFPVIAGLLALSLLPGVRQGAAYCNNNGTPWSWPWVPWPLFVFIGVATLFRTYALTISFLPSDAMETAFQPYFLIPFLLAVLIVMLEISWVERSVGLRYLALNLAPLLLWFSIPNSRGGGPATQFLDNLVLHAGSPIWLTVGALVLFYGVAWLRGMPDTRWRMLLSIVPLVWVGPRTIDWSTLTDQQYWPLALLGLVELARAIRRRDSWSALVGSISMACALGLYLGETSWAPYRRIVPYHLLLISILIISSLLNDGLSRFLRIIGAGLMPFTIGISLVVGDRLVWSNLAWGGYVTGMVLMTVACWLWTRDRAWLYSLLLMLIAACSHSIYLTIRWMMRLIGPRVLLPLAIGIGSFLIAIGITALKAGVGERWLRRLGLVKDEG